MLDLRINQALFCFVQSCQHAGPCRYTTPIASSTTTLCDFSVHAPVFLCDAAAAAVEAPPHLVCRHGRRELIAEDATLTELIPRDRTVGKGANITDIKERLDSLQTHRKSLSVNKDVNKLVLSPASNRELCSFLQHLVAARGEMSTYLVLLFVKCQRQFAL